MSVLRFKSLEFLEGKYDELCDQWATQVTLASGEGHSAEMAKRSVGELETALQIVIDAMQIKCPEKYGTPDATEELLDFSSPIN